MTPHSTERAHQISPLDLFAASAHGSSSVTDASRAFEAELNKVVEPVKAPRQRPAARRAAALEVERELARPLENFPETAKSGSRKLHSTFRPTKEEVRMSDEQQSSEESDQKEVAESPTSDPSQAHPLLSQVVPANQELAAGNAAGSADAASEAVVHVGADAALPLVEMVPQLANAASRTEAISNSAAPEVNEPVPGSEPPQTVSNPEINLKEPEVPGDGVVSLEEHAAAVHENGPLVLAEPGQNPSSAADAIASVDEQTAMAAVEIQPTESGGNDRDDRNSSSKRDDGPLPQVADVSNPDLPAAGVLTNPEGQAATASGPQPISSDTQPPLNDNSQSQSSPELPAASIQPASSRLPPHVLARSESHRGHNPAPVPIDSTRFLSRVAKAFLSAQQREGNEVRLRLSPPELGSLRLQVSVQDGVMTARMETETEAARTSLVNNLPELRERLAEQGIRVERFDIDLMQQPSTGTPDRPSDPQRNEPQPLRSSRPDLAVKEVSAPLTLGHIWNGQGRLNVIV